MSFEFVQSDFMILFATVILVLVLLSEFLSHDSGGPFVEKSREFLSWMSSITGWLLGIIFIAFFVTTVEEMLHY